MLKGFIDGRLTQEVGILCSKETFHPQRFRTWEVMFQTQGRTCVEDPGLLTTEGLICLGF